MQRYLITRALSMAIVKLKYKLRASSIEHSFPKDMLVVPSRTRTGKKGDRLTSPSKISPKSILIGKCNVKFLIGEIGTQLSRSTWNIKAVYGAIMK